MGRPSAQQRIRKCPRQSARKKAAAPVKVVYISNPMRVTTSAAKFRGIVQRLTGRDSNVAEMEYYEPDAASLLLDDDYDDAAAAASAGGVELSAGSPPASGSPAALACHTASGSLGVGGGDFGVDLYSSTLSEMFGDAFDPQVLGSSFPIMYEPQTRWILQPQ